MENFPQVGELKVESRIGEITQYSIMYLMLLSIPP